MRVLMVSASDLEGGAARAAYRLHQGFQAVGVTSNLLVQEKWSANPAVLAPRTRLAQGMARGRLTLDALPLKRYPNRSDATFSVQWVPDRLASQIAQLRPDIVNLHWINYAYMRIETLARLHQPLVWTLHDMWPFTGGCHYAQECDRYAGSCGQCPQLGSTQARDLSHRIWQRKSRSWNRTNLTIVALSDWLARAAASSSLFGHRRIEVIPNGIDTNRYRPLDRSVARDVLQLPQTKHLALFGALAATSDRRKGFHLLQPTLQRLSQAGWGDRLELIVVGADAPQNPPEFGLKVHYLGQVQDDLSLAMIYSAADVCILPSIQENLSNMVMESLACRTPCVAFDIGGMPDLIEHRQTGYLAQPYAIEDLAQGIAWVLNSQERCHQLGQRARQKVEQEFTQALQARRYQALFAELLQEQEHAGRIGQRLGQPVVPLGGS
jgi:glycosyltransferase involved in cell wall biosynthesis